MKKILLFIALATTIGTKAQTKFTVDNVEYTVTTASTVEVSDYTGSETELTIPSEVSNGDISYTVTAIGEASFHWSSVTKVNLPETIDSIKNSAFHYSDLTYINLPSSLKYIGDYALDTENLAEIDIPGSVEVINNSAFFGCTSLKKVTFHEGTKIIGRAAFYHAAALTSLTLPAGLDSIENTAFARCEKLESIALPSSLKKIGDGAFNECKALASITIPEGVTKIGEEAFFRCESLTSITFPKSLETLGASSIARTAISTITLADGNENFSIHDDCLYDKEATVLYAVPMRGKTKLSVLSGTVGINGGAAWGSEVSEISLPNTLLAIDDYAFERTPLTAVTFPSSITYIGEQAFADTELQNVTLPENMPYIMDAAFSSDSSLVEVTIPSAVTYIGSHAFSNCTNLSKVTIKTATPPTYEEVYDDYDDSFYHVASGAKLYVPKGSADAYKATEWTNNLDVVENENGVLKCTIVQPEDSSTVSGWRSMSFNLDFGENVTRVVSAPEVTVREGSILYSNIYTPDNQWNVTISGSKVNVWASDYDDYVESYKFDPSKIYFVCIPEGIVKNADGDMNERIVVHLFGTATGIESPVISNNESSEPEAVYNISGQRISKVQRGYNIVKYKDGSVKKVFVK